MFPGRLVQRANSIARDLHLRTLLVSTKNQVLIAGLATRGASTAPLGTRRGLRIHLAISAIAEKLQQILAPAAAHFALTVMQLAMTTATPFATSARRERQVNTSRCFATAALRDNTTLVLVTPAALGACRGSTKTGPRRTHARIAT